MDEMWKYILLGVLVYIFTLACIPEIWQALRNARYVDKLKKERDKLEGMPDIPEPDDDSKDKGHDVSKR